MAGGTGERHGVPFRNLAWAGALLTGLAVAGAALAYFELLHYRRCAAEHLPPQSEFAARLDVEQIVLFEPVRKQLLPLLDALPLGPAGAASLPPEATGEPAPTEDRLTRMRREAGLNLGLDLREILVATAAHGQRWVVVLGGLFPRSGLVPAIERTLRAEGDAGWSSVDGALEWPSGVALGQAQDGALIVASDRDTLRASLTPSQQYLALGLAPEGTGAAVLSHAGLTAWLWQGSPVQSFGALVKLGNELEVDVQLGFEDAQSAAAFAEQAKSATLVSALGPLTTGWGPSPLPALVEQAKVSGNTLQLVAHVRQTEFERALRDLAAWVRRRW